MQRKYWRTLVASYIGYVTQAINNNLAPLLFVTFQTEFQISTTQIAFLITYNFCVQMIIDLIATKYAEKVGYKKCIITAHAFSAIGLFGLGAFPTWFQDPYCGLLLAVTMYGLGGGLIEVLLSPIVQALPLNEKSSAMSLLHSFYAWGVVLVILLSTLFFQTSGIKHWRTLTALWALVPFANIFLYASAPVKVLSEAETSIPIRKLLGSKLFWLLCLLMICAGASEIAMSSWASYFAEKGLQISKTMGDLLGPCMFAALCGLSRLLYGTNKIRISLQKLIAYCSLLCLAGYLAVAVSPIPIVSLISCGVCGLSIGIMWPGTFSLAAEFCPRGGTAMFALLAMAGDIGCLVGPLVVSTIAEAFGSELKFGFFAVSVFPLILFAGIKALRLKSRDIH